jgi:hypothetical protein
VGLLDHPHRSDARLELLHRQLDGLGILIGYRLDLILLLLRQVNSNDLIFFLGRHSGVLKVKGLHSTAEKVQRHRESIVNAVRAG